MTPPSPKPPTTKSPDKDKRREQLGEHIGRELRAMFEDVVSEPVPERFQKLLEELERKQPKP
jgi:hypothetical protein